MKMIYSTDKEISNQNFKRWRDFITECMGPANHFISNDAPFQATIEFSVISNISFTRLSNSGAKTVISPSDARYKAHSDNVFVSIQMEGTSRCSQDGRVSVRNPGEFTVMDNRSGIVEADSNNKSLVLSFPRARIDKALGSTHRYTALTIGQDVASAFLATNFISSLVGASERLSHDAADRMSSIGIDLIIASISERLAQDIPRSLNSTVILQRAKAYIEAHLDDHSLDPSQLAAMLGVSLRRLQQLFHEQEHSISDWIWSRRLEVASRRLGDPGCAHHSIGELAYGCGFTNQAHFSRRFKNFYGLTPRDYRFRALISSVLP